MGLFLLKNMKRSSHGNIHTRWIVVFCNHTSNRFKPNEDEYITMGIFRMVNRYMILNICCIETITGWEIFPPLRLEV